MLTSGDVVDLDLGIPEGGEAGFRHPAVVVVTAQRILDAQPTVIQVVPLTTDIRGFTSEIMIEPDDANGLQQRSAALVNMCERCRPGGSNGSAATPAQPFSARSGTPSALSSGSRLTETSPPQIETANP